MFQLLSECSMDVFYSRKLLEMLPRKEAARMIETGSVATWVWEPVQWKAPGALENFGCSLHWAWSLINTQTEGQAGWGHLVHSYL